MTDVNSIVCSPKSNYMMSSKKEKVLNAQHFSEYMGDQNHHSFGNDFSPYHPSFFSIFVHESLSVTVRLKTGLPCFESALSTQKYPVRSN